MIKILKWIVHLLINPFLVFWLLTGIYFYQRFRKKSASHLWLYVALLWLLITGTRYVPDLLVYGLESRYDTYHPNVKPDSTLQTYIMILGGGSYADPEISPVEKLSRISLLRLNEGIRQYLLHPGSVLVFSGYSSNPPSQARLGAEAATSLGIPPEDIAILDQPKTTEEEVQAFKSFISDQNYRLILVTSDIHMPRAVRWFRQYGLDPIPAPGGSILRKDSRNKKWWWASDVSNFSKFSSACHEYIGLAFARLTS